MKPKRLKVIWTHTVDLIEIDDDQWRFFCSETERVSQIFESRTLAQIAWAGDEITWKETK
jgi:hypothetical protein